MPRAPQPPERGDRWHSRSFGAAGGRGGEQASPCHGFLLLQERQFGAPREPFPISVCEARKGSDLRSQLQPLRRGAAGHQFRQIAGDERVTRANGIHWLDWRGVLLEEFTVDAGDGALAAQRNDGLRGAEGSQTLCQSGRAVRVPDRQGSLRRRRRKPRRPGESARDKTARRPPQSRGWPGRLERLTSRPSPHRQGRAAARRVRSSCFRSPPWKASPINGPPRLTASAPALIQAGASSDPHALPTEQLRCPETGRGAWKRSPPRPPTRRDIPRRR